MAKKMLRKQRIAIQKLEERVLFDAAGAAEIVDAAAAAAATQPNNAAGMTAFQQIILFLI